jgi:predicted 3-demethylubiquinone-9 3-methyltransferase (glyoxalase superfamily)
MIQLSRIIFLMDANQVVYARVGQEPEGTVTTASFPLEMRKFVALNGGPQFTFWPAFRHMGLTAPELNRHAAFLLP